MTWSWKWLLRRLLPDRHLRVEVAAHAPILPVLGQQLKDTSAQVGDAVVSVCNNFNAISTRAREAVSGTARLLDGDGEASGVDAMIQTSRDTFHRLLERMERGSDLSLKAISHMQQVEAAMKRVVRVLGEVERIAFSNRLLALNAKVQAVHVGELGAGFGVVADEISAQAQRSNEHTEEIHELVRALADGVRGAIENLREIASIDHSRAAESRAEVEAVLQALEDSNHRMRNSLREAATGSERLADDISAAIVSLQFQDRMHQRIEHVVNALEMIHRALAGRPSSSPLDASDRSREIQAQLAGSYTMDCERSVHQGSKAESGVSDEGVELF